MSTLRTAAQQALEALEFLSLDFFMLDPISPGREEGNKAITALRAALAEPVQEPYCHVYEYDGVFGLHREFYPCEYNGRKPDRVVPMFTAPQRKPLTDEEIAVIEESCMGPVQYGGHENMTQERVFDVLAFARAVEQAHGIK